MSLKLTELIGQNIKKHREKFQMSQKDLASKVNIARPVISNWENGKSEPSSSQLVQLSKVFNISTDEIVGNTADIKSAVIVDTSALIKRPRIVEELNSVFNEVIIPEVVIAELNNLKDNNSKPAVKQKAWLVMKSITDKGDLFTITKNIKHEGKNDEKIAEIALHRAKSKPYDHVYLLTDDIWFQFLTKEQSNLEAITPALYSERFLQTHKESNPTKNIEFYSLVKSKKLAEVQNFDLTEVDINVHDPDSGLTPLIQTVRNRDLKMLDYLISLPDMGYLQQREQNHNRILTKISS